MGTAYRLPAAKGRDPHLAKRRRIGYGGGMIRAALLFALLTLTACHKPGSAQKAAPAAATVPAEQAALTRMIIDDCAGFAHVKDFHDWQVTVLFYQTSTVNESIDVTFSAGNHIHLEDVVMPSDPVYPAVARLEQGGPARISGRFLHGASECAYRIPTAVELTAAE